MPYGYRPSNAAHNLEEDASSQALETDSIAADSITAEGMAAHDASSTPLGAFQSSKNLYLGTDARPVLVLAQELVYTSILSNGRFFYYRNCQHTNEFLRLADEALALASLQNGCSFFSYRYPMQSLLMFFS